MTLNHEPPRPGRIVDRILGSRNDRMMGDTGKVPEGSAEYQAYSITSGFPQMGFTLGVYHRGTQGITVESHGVLFHDVKKPKWKTFEGSEYIHFSHVGETYTLRGRGLYELYLALMNNTLQSALAFESTVFVPVNENGPIIDRVAITDVTEMVRKSR